MLNCCQYRQAELFFKVGFILNGRVEKVNRERDTNRDGRRQKSDDAKPHESASAAGERGIVARSKITALPNFCSSMASDIRASSARFL